MSQTILFIVLPTYLVVFSAGYLVARWNRGHTIMTLGLGPRAIATSITSPINSLRTLSGLLVSLILFPLLPILALLSIPFFMIAGQIQRRRGAEFSERMRHLGRAISWPEAEQHAITKEGRLIREILWMNGGSRLWWTPEILPNRTPFTYCRPGDNDKSPFDKEFQAFGKWCFENYTNPSMGRAVLIEIPKGSRRLIWKQINDAGFEYVITHYRNKAKGQATKNGE
jgi:hypothetical protein